MNVEHFDREGRRLTETVPQRRTMLSGWYSIGSVPRDCYYPIGMISGRVLGTMATANDRIYAIPFVTSNRRVLSSITINLTGAGAAGANARVAIYRNADDGDMYPGSLYANLGEYDLSSTGVKTISGLSVALDPNHCWWFAYHAENARTIRALNYTAGSSLLACTGLNILLPTTPGVGWYGISAYGSGLPDPFPALVELSIDPPALCARFSS